MPEEQPVPRSSSSSSNVEAAKETPNLSVKEEEEEAINEVDAQTVNDDDTVTAEDVLRAQTELERDAAEVLPGRFDRCTVSLGPTRQNVYACLTCAPTQARGLCYACSIACHAEHQLVELFYRRRFVCDCGSGKMSSPCQLSKGTTVEEMDDAVKQNSYDHNYLGRFCRCDTTYDPEEETGTMYQCVVCEDWFHERCIDRMPASPDDFEEFCCHKCVDRLPFLKQYALVLPEASAPMASDATQEEAHTNERKRSLGVDVAEDSRPAAEHMGDAETAKRICTADTLADVAKDVATSSSGLICKLTHAPATSSSTADTADTPAIDLFFTDGWRERLCRCNHCMDTYRKHDVEYLLAAEKAHEPEKDEESGMSLFELGVQKLQGMDRVQAVNGLLAYDRMRNEIRSFLSSFASAGTVVTKNDVEAFFAEKMQRRA
ncbi:putative zinc finger in N-recognin-domain-containing protein [Thamnocephalis sphaerospora]|uniref:Putative zinc finger in N-recognin-domain-containing protein n=1 Tax=Thamnocephalis sphaerospora TaxID=78915 RepID=A0A4P9XWV7_9FUNG|nr:putative zinc finger in N-recognin-domain-containing protein [Thamnocephalis sphaerospora]|eukprot:RKP10757.1 putative zinc finger in N-recognin-domain-containing protein [Thamnocephalis sphaerospora]